jgi:hypothetical protein
MFLNFIAEFLDFGMGLSEFLNIGLFRDRNEESDKYCILKIPSGKKFKIPLCHNLPGVPVRFDTIIPYHTILTHHHIIVRSVAADACLVYDSLRYASRVVLWRAAGRVLFLLLSAATTSALGRASDEQRRNALPLPLQLQQLRDNNTPSSSPLETTISL